MAKAHPPSFSGAPLAPPALQGLRAMGGATNLPTATGERDTTALFNPQWDQWLNDLAGAEGATPDAGGVTHLTLGGPKRPTPHPALAGIRATFKPWEGAY